ncbi:helix-turn-helix domain-containing protein [Sphingobacterium ginsenosidimutans]|uniref:Helix-turn-helix domain-containing protein n=1 Tax=Sphingobacterium ginsenosidimutans TaxID=687845 RepID=A0ABP7ZVB4_9SPHI
MVIRKEKLDFLRLTNIDSASNGIVIMPIAEYLQVKVQQKKLHAHSYYSVLLIKSGGLTMVADKRMYTMGRHDMLSISADCVCSFLHNIPVEGSIILFTEAFFMQSYDKEGAHYFNYLKCNRMNGFVLSSDDIERCSHLMELMQTEYRTAKLVSKELLRNQLLSLLQLLGHRITKNIGAVQMDEKEERIMTFETLVDENYREKRFPSFYAERLNMSVNHLNRICREKRAVSCGALIRNRIILEAERLLYHTFKTVREIAIELGFDNVPYFITFFKAKKGQSPEEFRKTQ